MDAFYASVEQLDDPSLRGKPVLVGGASRRGVVTAASYEARPFGARSAMPMAEALRKCRDAIVVPPRMARYREVSDRVFEIFGRFTPLVEGLSVDEAFLDVTASRALFGEGEAIAQRIKETIRSETGLTASAGVAPSKFVAKIASDLEKPDGLVVVRDGEVERFLAPLDVDRMWGVGPTAAARLRQAGFHTIGDLAEAGEARLESLLGSWGRAVARLARGVDDRAVVTDGRAKSVGAEETYERDLHRTDEILKHLLDQSRRVARRLYKAGLRGRVVTVKLKYADFTLRTRQQHLPAAMSDTDSIYAACVELVERFPRTGEGIRLTGVSVSGLEEEPRQQPLFADPRSDRREKLQRAVSELEDRYGFARVTRAALLDEDD